MNVAAKYAPGPFVPRKGQTSYVTNPVRLPVFQVQSGRNPLAAFANTAFANSGSQLTRNAMAATRITSSRFGENIIPLNNAYTYTALKKQQDAADAADIRQKMPNSKFQWAAEQKMAQLNKHNQFREGHMQAVHELSGAPVGVSTMEIDDMNARKEQKDRELSSILSTGVMPPKRPLQEGSREGSGARRGQGLNITGSGMPGLAKRLAQDMQATFASVGRRAMATSGQNSIRTPQFKKQRGDMAHVLPRIGGKFAKPS
jgi:hypothetical protein